MRKIYYISCDLSTAGLRFVFYRWMHPSLPEAMAQQGRLSCRRREIFWKKGTGARLDIDRDAPPQ